MDIYLILRQFADSWMLFFLFSFFIGCVVWAFRPGSKKAHKDAADIPFRNEHAPAADAEPHTGRRSNGRKS
ncbi:MAG: cbb3-type cytochrome c oxidase subunit 3 [Halocynthiibacter sp.]